MQTECRKVGRQSLGGPINIYTEIPAETKVEYKSRRLTGGELAGALGSPPASDLSGDAGAVLLTGCQARLGEGGQAALHLDGYLLVLLLLLQQDNEGSVQRCIHIQVRENL